VRWVSPTEPAPRAARSGGRRPERLLRKCSALWRIPVVLCHPRRGCGQKWELPAAAVATSGFQFRGFVASTVFLKDGLNSFFTAPCGPNRVWNLDAFGGKTWGKRAFSLKPACKKSSCASSALPSIRHFSVLLERL